MGNETVNQSASQNEVEEAKRFNKEAVYGCIASAQEKMNIRPDDSTHLSHNNKRLTNGSMPDILAYQALVARCFDKVGVYGGAEADNIRAEAMAASKRPGQRPR